MCNIQDIKHGMISYTVEEIDNDSFVINDTSSGWLQANINSEEFELFKKNELNLETLTWY